MQRMYEENLWSKAGESGTAWQRRIFMSCQRLFFGAMLGFQEKNRIPHTPSFPHSPLMHTAPPTINILY